MHVTRTLRPLADRVADLEMEIVKKLSLKIEELEISTFETAEVEKKTGTVEAFLGTKIHQYTCDPAVGTCFGYTCVGACF